MRLLRLKLTSFRIHRETEVEFSAGVNLIFGRNGVGKTNVLEAIHTLCLSKSFLESKDQYVLRRGDPYYQVEGDFLGERRGRLSARVAFVPSEGKRIHLNGAPLERLSDIVGTLPVVVFAPDDYVITSGGPEERRKFLNNILSQERPSYLEDIWSYQRALRQRNELLAQFQGRPGALPSGLLDSWNAEFVRHASRVIHHRQLFLQDFKTYLERAYSTMEHVVERPSIRYVAAVELQPDSTEAEIGDLLHARLEEVHGREFAIGRTAIGPHRDELRFRLNDMDVRRYASQGQHRTFGMALKLAQFFYLRERMEETPILLLDDIFDHLDPQRTEAVLELLTGADVGQSILTATRPDIFTGSVDFKDSSNLLIAMRPGEHGPEVFEGKAPERISAV